MKESKLMVMWHWFGLPFRIVPKVDAHASPTAGSVVSVSWLGSQLHIFRGFAAEFALTRLEGKERK
ncbi:hypothetical protein Q0M94_28510 (plasmid) [Deinococcus radiomollis]|uniref:hypothetical protein n=1 Tax=Deinococcus radiomollis TaxID=468916 RepID=UPI00389121D8